MLLDTSLFKPCESELGSRLRTCPFIIELLSWPLISWVLRPPSDPGRDCESEPESPLEMLDESELEREEERAPESCDESCCPRSVESCELSWLESDCESPEESCELSPEENWLASDWESPADTSEEES